MALECRVVHGSGPQGDRAYLSGAIDEHTRLNDVFAQLTKIPGEALILDLQGVIRINSIGIRGWIPLITQLTSVRRVTVEGLSYPFVIQANNVYNLLAGARVHSVMAPYFCRLCEANRMVLVTGEEVQPSIVPAKACMECGNQMEFDELENYFAFLRRK
jgi:hypothetical protein